MKGLNTKESQELTKLLQKLNFDQAVQTIQHLSHRMEYGEFQEVIKNERRV